MPDKPNPQSDQVPPEAESPAPPSSPPVEIGGRKGPEPTRYGDWEKGGIAVDF